MLIYVKETIKCNLLEWSPELEMECIGLKAWLSPEISFILTCLYRPPSSSSTFYDKLHKMLKCFEKTTTVKQYHLRIPKNDMDKFKSALNYINWTDLLSIEGIENSCNIFLTTVDNIITSYR